MVKQLKYEFDTWEELLEAMEHLEDYHDCGKCHGKMIGIGIDKLGNSICMYCGKIVKYPKLSKKGFEIEKAKWYQQRK